MDGCVEGKKGKAVLGLRFNKSELLDHLTFPFLFPFSSIKSLIQTQPYKIFVDIPSWMKNQS